MNVSAGGGLDQKEVLLDQKNNGFGLNLLHFRFDPLPVQPPGAAVDSFVAAKYPTELVNKGCIFIRAI